MCMRMCVWLYSYLYADCSYRVMQDFEGYLPGHGGLVDRMDCQLLMALGTAVHLNAFVVSDVTVCVCVCVRVLVCECVLSHHVSADFNYVCVYANRTQVSQIMNLLDRMHVEQQSEVLAQLQSLLTA
jgi:hypothetical protein